MADNLRPVASLNDANEYFADRLYADAFSTYNGMPWLNARYTYLK